MVPAPLPSSMHTSVRVSCQATEDEGPKRLLLSSDNVVALGADLPEPNVKTSANASSAPLRKRRKGRQEQHKPRRVRKAKERSNRAVWSVVPEGYKPARHIVQWLRSIQNIPEYQLARKDLKANIWRFVNALAQCPGFDPASMTMMPLWQRLQERFGFPPKSISNYFRRLRDWRALAVVATGRTAEFTPKSSGRTDNEAAIYVLLEPLDVGQSEGVEKSSVPVPTRAVNNPRTRGRTKVQNLKWKRLRRSLLQNAPHSVASSITNWSIDKNLFGILMQRQTPRTSVSAARPSV
ncbi:hypothetical protein ARZXY2_4883 (plasmid) [Arthrobacter sp. ZXY-2]|nr:hypothetical protein ARZXY2_4883 [Arthrobacter sp. ZXY-2]